MPVSGRRPPWLRVRLGAGPGYTEVKSILRQSTLHTVCEEARCPNIGECFGHHTATFLILGRVCTRNCRFCAIGSGKPDPLDQGEPERVAQAVQALGLRHAVITSVTRDDLPDGGAGVFAATVAKIRELVPTCSIELLVPDFQGSSSAIESVTRAKPDILNHNLETVPRLYRTVRPGASYRRSLELLRSAKMLDSTLLTKSGLMVGLGETWDEIERTMADLHDVSCDILTIGQYLQPSAKHLAVERYYEPAEFGRLREAGLRLGFRHVEAGALVRSSYHAFEQIQQSVQRDATDQA